MIKINELKEEDKGKFVEYNDKHRPKEKGVIKSWNDTYVFVVYQCNNEWDRYYDYTGVATNPDELTYV